MGEAVLDWRAVAGLRRCHSARRRSCFVVLDEKWRPIFGLINSRVGAVMQGREEQRNHEQGTRPQGR